MQSHSTLGGSVQVQPPAVLPIRKTKHQEEQEDVTRPAWVLSGAPWVTIAFAIVQVRDMMTLVKNSGPSPDAHSLQVKISCVRCLF